MRGVLPRGWRGMTKSELRQMKVLVEEVRKLRGEGESLTRMVLQHQVF